MNFHFSVTKITAMTDVLKKSDYSFPDYMLENNRCCWLNFLARLTKWRNCYMCQIKSLKNYAPYKVVSFFEPPHNALYWRVNQSILNTKKPK